MITPRDAIRAIELYYEGGGLRYLSKASSDMKQTTQTPRLFQRFLNEPSLTESQQTLVRYPESLKSAMQLTVVLRHLHHYYPNCDFDVVSSSAQAAALAGVCRKVYVEGRDRIDTSQYDEVLFFKTPSHSDATDRSFVSEPNRYLIDELLLEPIAAFGKYEIGISEAVQQQARELLAARCSKVPEDDEGRFAVVLIQDGTGQRLPSKRLTAEIVNELALTVSGLGYTPLLLRSTEARRAPVSRAISQHVTDELVLNTIEINEIGLLAAVIEFSSMVISIDTGVLHVAAATTTPTVGVWNSPQPIEQISPADNVLHLIADEEEAGRHVGTVPPFTGVRFRRFKQLDVELPAVVQSMLTGRDVQQLITERFLNQFAPTGFAERYLHEEKSRGVDYLYFGRWQKQYGQWLVESLDLKDKRVLDVGCASGAITRSLSRAGAIALGVDINEALIRLGKAKWEELEELLQVCDAVNLHRIADQSQDCVHAGRVLEYLRPQQVEVALSEMRRVTKPEGLLLVMIKKQRSDIRGQSDQPDPRQLCVQPLSWWHDRLPAAGWQLCSEEIAHDLQTHPFCCLNRVWWDWFAARPV